MHNSPRTFDMVMIKALKDTNVYSWIRRGTFVWRTSQGEEVAQIEEGGSKSLSEGAKALWKKDGTMRNDEVFWTL